MATAFGLSPPQFSQSTVVIATIAGAWLLWLAANNKLLTYWQILLGQGAGQAQAPNTVVNNPVSTTGQPTTGTATGTVTPISPIQSIMGSAPLVPGITGF